MKTTLKINIWDLIDIEEMNKILDDKLEYKFCPTNIKYSIVNINKKGILELEVKFQKLSD
jgi:hypothetical protein